MKDIVQCENCGAVLAPEDIFCGECGAPRPAAAGEAGPLAVEQPAMPSPAPSAQPSPPPPGPSAQTGWRAAFITLLVLGAVTCLVGLVTFLLFGATESDTVTREEGWLYGALCCLLPFGGLGAVLAVTGLGIWYVRLRNR